MAFDVRQVAEEEIPALWELAKLAFHMRPEPPEERAHVERFLASARRFGAYEDGALIGSASSLDFMLSIPGGELPCAGVTVAVVAPTHRRRGALTMVMGALLDEAASRDVPLAALWAAEGAIYGRYGFGVATYGQEVEV